MANFDAYKARVHQRGDTERDRTLYYEKEYLKELAINSLSCKPCEVDGVEQSLVIDDGTLPYYKDIKSLPDEYFDAGNLVKFADAMWLIVSCDWDKEVYTYGKMQQCNYLLKWQNSDAETIDCWSVVLSASKYNNGEKYNNIIVVGSNQLMVYLPLNEETKKLSANKRLLIDFNTVNPKCYDVTRVDRIDLMLCDYIDPSEVQPTSPILITYSGRPEIRIGGRKTFTAETENAVTFSLISSALVDGKLTITQTGNKCIVKCALDSSIVGASFKVEAAGGGQRTDLLVDIISAV